MEKLENTTEFSTRLKLLPAEQVARRVKPQDNHPETLYKFLVEFFCANMAAPLYSEMIIAMDIILEKTETSTSKGTISAWLTILEEEGKIHIGRRNGKQVPGRIIICGSQWLPPREFRD